VNEPMVTIPLNNFQGQCKAVRADVLAAVDGVGTSGCYILGREVERFEAALASAWGLPHAVGVGNGLDAIEIGLRCLAFAQATRSSPLP